MCAELWKPHNYQKKGMKFQLEHGASALFFDPGLGKSAITLGSLKILQKKKIVSRTLIIAPVRVCYNVWPNEINKWKDFNHFTYHVLHGEDKEAFLEEDSDICLINPEGLDWLLGVSRDLNVTGRKDLKIDKNRWKRLQFDTLVIDELSKFKGTNTNRWPTMKKILGSFSRRWGLTGSPAAENLMGLFGQCYMLDQGNALGQYITHYRAKYFSFNHYSNVYSLQPGAEKRIYKRLSNLALRMSDKDYLKVPQVVNHTIYVDLPPKPRRIYDEMEKDLITMMDHGEVTAANAPSASIKCRQIASGGVYHAKEPGKVKKRTHLHEEKINALADLIEELQGKPLLIFHEFKHDLERIKKKVGKNTPCIGEGSAKQDQKIIKDWNAGKLSLLLAHPESAAHGLNLQGAGQFICWHSLTWRYELYDQAIRRLRRQGNKHTHIFVYHILARNTIDQKIYAVLQRKKQNQNALFSALVELQKQRGW